MPAGRPAPNEAHMVATPEHRTRPPRRRSRRRRGRRHRGDRVAAGSSPSASRWRRHQEAERDARRRDRGPGHGEEAAEAPPSPAKKPRVRSEVGLVRGCAWRFDPFSPEDDDAVGVPAAAAPASPSSAAAPAANNCNGMVFAPPEPAPTKGSAGAAPSSSSAAPPAPTTGVLFACQVSIPPPPRPVSTQAAPQPLFFTGGAAAVPPPRPASTPCPAWMKMIPSTSRQPYAAAIPAIPQFPMVVPPPEQPVADAEELRRAKVERYAGLIAKKQQETAERYRKLLRSGQAPAPPEPPPKAPKPEPAVVDKETLRRIAAARWRFRGVLEQLERKAKEAALFVQMAPPEQLRALGIDQDMERVVSPERPRDENGAPVVSPEHPCSLVEMLGFFLKAAE